MEILLENVSFTYVSPVSGDHRALQNVTLDVRAGEILAVIGSTGSGKTTLLQHLNGLLEPTSGRILFNGRQIRNKRELNGLRARVGLVFQFPEHQLFEETVRDDVAFGPRNRGVPEGEVTIRVEQALTRVGLNADVYGGRSPFHLSGGEQRRVAVAGVLAMDPEVLVLDEPTVGLDPGGGMQVESILKAFHSMGRTVIVASHDMELVARLATRVAVLSGGMLRFHGSKSELFRDAALLAGSGLIMPQVPRFMSGLKARGFPLKTECYTVEEARREMDRFFREGKHR